MRAAAESFKHVDNLTVLNGAQGISQVIGQAGPALKMAQEALGRTNGAQRVADEPARAAQRALVIGDLHQDAVGGARAAL